MNDVANRAVTESGASAALDGLLIHPAKEWTYYGPLNVYGSCNRMAMGLLALADFAVRKGHNVRVLHTGIERVLDPKFDIANVLRERRPLCVGLSIHFHHSLVDAVRLIREIRVACPDAFIFAGGFTASWFATDLLETMSELDAVIRGDAELPLDALLGAVKSGGALDGIDNLVWRRDGAVVDNGQEYVVTEEILNDLTFTRFDLLDHGDQYRLMPKAYIRTNLPAALTRQMNNVISKQRTYYFWGLPVGRGCPFRCFYCGGGARAQRLINRRRGVIFREPERVLDTMRELKQAGFHGAYVSFDPHPQSHTYYVDLFRRMRETKLEFDWMFSSWGLPSEAFLDAFSETMGPRSSFLISPETGSEKLRRMSRGDYYSNDELVASLKSADRRGIRTMVFFCIGLPGEHMEEFQETLDLRDRILRECEHATVEAFMIEIEPASPWFLDPEKYGITLGRRTLDDFLTQESRSNYSSMSSLGYTSSFFGDEPIDEETFSRRLLDLKCTHFCDHQKSCKLMKMAWGLLGAFGVVPRPSKQKGA
ncbi:MAG: radical SAM protein [Verrucomicrobia bacterium]|jgi:radical SAM superfamily enzyme YgiQ (UPF0313 family)|nr:radical SAM protein [Verrucomicrobiota bacterium]